MQDDLQKARLRYPRLWVLRLRDAVVVILLMNTGLRIGELCDLALADVMMSPRKGKIIVRQGKGERRREIPLNAEARKSLNDWRTIRGG